MHLHQLDAIEDKEVVKGFRAKFIHSDHMTFAYWTIAEGSALPGHSHAHEQVVNMLEGAFELTVDGHARTLAPGDVVVVPPNAVHAGRAVTDCRILDVFHPVRDDYRQAPG